MVRLSSPSEFNRTGGAGVYYHVSTFLNATLPFVSRYLFTVRLCACDNLQLTLCITPKMV